MRKMVSDLRSQANSEQNESNLLLRGSSPLTYYHTIDKGVLNESSQWLMISLYGLGERSSPLWWVGKMNK